MSKKFYVTATFAKEVHRGEHAPAYDIGARGCVRARVHAHVTGFFSETRASMLADRPPIYQPTHTLQPDPFLFLFSRPPSLSSLSLSLSPSVYLHSYGRAYRACIEASYVRTYVQKEGEREKVREREKTHARKHDRGTRVRACRRRCAANPGEK